MPLGARACGKSWSTVLTYTTRYIPSLASVADGESSLLAAAREYLHPRPTPGPGFLAALQAPNVTAEFERSAPL